MDETVVETPVAESGSEPQDGQGVSQGLPQSVDPAVPPPPAQEATEEATEEAPKSEAPEDYGDFTDAKGVAFSSKEMPEFVAMAKELGLSKERANALLMTMVPTVKTKIQSSLSAVQASWGRAAKADTEIGGEHFKENLAIANQAYRRFASPELANLMKQSGLYAHPDFIRMFLRIGKAMQEDTGVQGTGAPQPKRKLFPNSNMG